MQTPINMNDTLQEEPVSPAPEDVSTTEVTKQEEETQSAAIVPLEEEVIDGEVTAIIEPEHKPQPKQPPYYLMVVGTILACLLYLAVSLLLPLLTPSAAVLLIPTEQHIAATTAIQVHGRLLPAFTLSQSQTTPATGERHQDATEAQGTITFYNGLFTSQTIASDTILTGSDGVQVITDEPAIIPAANPPYIGQVTVRAHTLDTGVQGNIQAYDINQACCVTAVKAVNTTAFTGGQSARDYLVVTKSDIASRAATIIGTLEKSERAALHAQAITGESLTPPWCSEKITTDHKPGDQAKNVTVTVSETCTSIAYHARDVDQNAIQLIPSQATTALGANYSPIGGIQVAIIHATITDQARGIATLRVKLDATYVYQISPGEKQHLVTLIAGKTTQQAQALVSQEPGIAGAVITINGNAATLPDNPQAITIVVVKRV